MKSTISLLRTGSACMLIVLAPGAPDSSQPFTTLVGTVGSDTVAIDRFSRDDKTLEGVLLVRVPETHTMHYKATLAPGGRFTTVHMVWRDAAGTELRSAWISFGIDSIRSNLRESETRSVGAPPQLDAIPLPPRPYAFNAYAFLEHAAIVLFSVRRPDAADVDWIMVGETDALTKQVRRMAGDTVEFDFVAGTLRMHLDDDGRLDWLSGGDTTARAVVHRAVADVDLAALTASFAGRDTAVRRQDGANRRH